MLNSIGIPSKGLDYYRREVLPPYTRYDTPVVVSISADTVDEFAQAVAEMSLPEVAVIEANISCPNLEADGMAFAMTPETTYKVVSAIRRRTRHPVLGQADAQRVAHRGGRQGRRRSRRRCAGDGQHGARHGHRHPHAQAQAR